ncbi:hypothetical protein G6M86_06400 [Agrobacterium tumefaciens]|uniref:SGNH hydrolase-type esterase domain-containing protein n=1 Tax=Agrobacterium tumefaciens TaxID=358 RepID=A0AAJ4N1F0_AGRTU|nr:hypothetical protein G6M86_06400 [Agrobacterium tumefaciens]
MSSVFPITDDPRYRRYTASAGQTVFPIPFPFLQDGDLKIFLQTAPSEYALFDPADYALSGANDPSGGTVTLDTPRSAGDIILVLGAAILDRMTSIVRDGRFGSALMDSELDRIRIIEQEFRRENNLALKVDYGGTGLTVDTGIADGRTLMKQGDRVIAGPDLPELASDLIASATAEADRAEQEANRSDGQADRSRAEADRAAAIVNDIASEKEVPIVGIVQALPGLFLPAGMTAIRTNGFAAMGDGGAWPLAVAVENSGPLQPWQRQSNGGARRWQLVSDTVSLEQFGAKGDNVANDRQAAVSARAWLVISGGALRLAGGKTYYLGDTATDLSGIRIVAEPGSRLRGNIDLSKENLEVPDDLDISIDAFGVKYPYKMPRGFKKPFAEKELWIGAGDLIRDRYTRVDPGSLNKVKVAHPGGDTFAADALPIAADQTISWNMTAGGEWHCGLRPAIGGRELSAVFSGGDYQRAAFFVWSGGWIALAAGPSSIGVTLYKKDIGQPIITAVQTWRGASDHEQWRSVNCEWTVRIYSENLAALVMNGTEVYRFQVPNGGIFTEYGFGVFASADPIVAGVSRWTERTTQSFGGQAQVAITVFGDSKASPFYGVWADACREALDGSFGIRCIDMQNHAIAGSNSLNVLNKMQDVGLGIANYVIIDAFTNDQQQGSPLSASLSNLQTMLDNVSASGRRPVVPIHPLYLNTSQTPDGFVTANAEKGAELRAAVRTMAASYNALIVDTQQLTGQILADFITSPDISDPRLRDRIHYTPFAYRLVGWAIARAIAGDIVVSGSPQIRRTEFPVRYFSNGWYATLRTPRITVDDSRVVQMEGILEAGTRTDGTTIVAFPVNLRPAGWKSFPSYSVRTSDGRRTGILLEVSSDGDLKIYGMPADDLYVYLDPVRYEAA